MCKLENIVLDEVSLGFDSVDGSKPRIGIQSVPTISKEKVPYKNLVDTVRSVTRKSVGRRWLICF